MYNDKTRVRSKVESDFGIRMSCTISSEEAPKVNGSSRDENIDSFGRCHKFGPSCTRRPAFAKSKVDV